MVKKKLDGAVDYSSESADQKIRKWDATVHNLGKIWRPAPSGTGSYSRLAGWLAGWPSVPLADEIWARLEIAKACCRSKYSSFCFVQLRYCIVSATLMHF